MDVSLRFVTSALAVWRLTHMMSEEEGPWQILARLCRTMGTGMLGQLSHCFFCLSVWVALPFSFFVATEWLEAFIAWWGLSGAAVLLERATRNPLEVKIEE